MCLSDGCGVSHGNEVVGPCQSELGGQRGVELRAKFKVVGHRQQDIQTPAISRRKKKKESKRNYLGIEMDHVLKVIGKVASGFTSFPVTSNMRWAVRSPWDLHRMQER